MSADVYGQDMNGGTAGVVARPIRLFPAALLLGFVLDHLVPLPFVVQRAAPLLGFTLDQPPSFQLGTSRIGMVHWIIATIAGTLFLIGIALFAAGVRNFSRAATPLPTNQPARVLVTTGVHAWTRNPIYLGFFLMYAGIGIAARSPSVLALTLPLAVTIRYGVVAREEAYLERRFGDTYRDYRSRVRRWL